LTKAALNIPHGAHTDRPILCTAGTKTFSGKTISQFIKQQGPEATYKSDHSMDMLYFESNPNPLLLEQQNIL